MSQIFGGGVRVARKEHKCAWCGDPILSGEQHHWWSGVDDGSGWTRRRHQACNDPLIQSVAMDTDGLFCEGEGKHQRGARCGHRD